VCSAHGASMFFHELTECYNVAKEEHDEEDTRNIQITEGERTVEGLDLEYDVYAHPLKTWKVNIGTKENPKFVQIGGYWNDETVEKIAYLLHEYLNLFPTMFSEMKGIIGDLGEINISLKPDAKPMRQRPYKLNPKYKEKVKAEIDQMLEARIVEPIVESEWIIPMVGKGNKIGGIRICLYLSVDD
jgi:hypothetical protein